MNSTEGMTAEDVAMLIDIANAWVYEWVVIRADPPMKNNTMCFYAYEEEPTYDDGSEEWVCPHAVYLTADNFDIDPRTFRIDNPAKR